MIKYVIPSRDRNLMIKTKVLKFLKEINVSNNDVYIFTNQYSKYSYLLDEGYNLVKSVKGLSNQRNFIRNYFPEQTQIIYLDDDLDGIEIENEIKNKKSILEIFSESFEIMKKNNIYLGSINPTRNSYFRTNNYKIGYYLAVGCFYFEINLHHPDLYLQKQDFQDEKEDYIRTINYYLHFGDIFRNDFCNVIHDYSKNPGGLNNNPLQRKEHYKKSVKWILDKYPNYVELKKTKNKLEVRLIDKYKLKRHQKQFTRIQLIKYQLKDIQKGDYLDGLMESTIKLAPDKNYDFFLVNQYLGTLFRNAYQINIDNINIIRKLSNKISTTRGDIAGKIDMKKLHPYQIKKIEAIGVENVDFNKSRTPKTIQVKQSSKLVLIQSKFSFSNPIKSANYHINLLPTQIREFINNITKNNNAIKNNNKVIINQQLRSALHKDKNNQNPYVGLMVMDTSLELHLLKGFNLSFPEFNLELNMKPNSDLLIFNTRDYYHCNLLGSGLENRISMVIYSHN